MVTLRLPPIVLRCDSECPCTSADGLVTRSNSAGRLNVWPSSKAMFNARRSFTSRISTGHAAVTWGALKRGRPGSARPDQIVAGIANPGAAVRECDVAWPLDAAEHDRNADRGDGREQQGRKKNFHGAPPELNLVDG